MKNVIFIPAIDAGRGRHHSYEYSIKSWRHWADKNDCQVLVWDEAIYSWDEMTIPWQRYHLFKILESNNVNYDQVLMVDCDTVINPNTPNFFEMTDHKYSAVLDNGCWEWTGRSLRHYKDLFDNFQVERGMYFNGGFQIVNKNHKKFFETMKKFYDINSKQILDAIEKIRAGTDQTILNFMLHKEKVDVKYLPIRYNLQDLYRKNTIIVDKEMQHWMIDKLYFLEVGWVYHFNSIPPNPMNRDANYWIERTYKELYK